MKKIKYFLGVWLSLFALITLAQQPQKEYADYTESSLFTLDSLDIQNPQIKENLETLCRVWGYAKYHHPIFADSTLNVDYELFELLPKVAYADKQTRNKVLCEWVNGLGEFTPNKKMYDDAFAGVEYWYVTDSEWICDSLQIGDELSGLLQDLHYAEREDNNYYIKYAPGNVIIDFDNESYHMTVGHYDCGYQLLTLFRFWNILEYYNPNRLILDKPWGDVLTEHITPIVDDWTTNPINYFHTLMSLNKELCDGHAFTSLYDRYFGHRIAPIYTRFIDNSLVIVDPAEVDGLEIGDEIIKIDGRLIAERADEIKRYVAASNEAGYRQKVAVYALCSSKDEATLTFLRNGKQDSLALKTVTIYEFSLWSTPEKYQEMPYYLLNDSIGYVYTQNFTPEMNAVAMDLFRNTKAIIFDLRCYYELTYGDPLIGDYLIKDPAHYIKFANPTPALPGRFYFAPGTIPLYKGDSEPGSVPKENPDAYKGEIIVLVDEMTQSSAECSAMAFQAIPRTCVVGSQTAGANGNIELVPLPGGNSTYLSTLGCYYPDGYNMQRKGVKIDVEVHPTIEGIKAGRDEVLEKAILLCE